MKEDLTRPIADALAADESLSSQPIDLFASNGVVVLRGRVQSYRSKLRAQEIAAGIAGVEQVRNELAVECAEIRSDAEVADDVRALLQEHDATTKESIVVSVLAGRVTLSGCVASEHERIVAGDLALRAPGAQTLHNHLIIAEPEKAEATAVNIEVEHELAKDPRLVGCDLRVASSGSIAVLSGTVRSEAQRRIAEQVVRAFWIAELENEIRVEP